ncbi:MAG: hypothetical protein ACI840_000705 [Ulvibacter sp.]|jgi:hypothetical protein
MFNYFLYILNKNKKYLTSTEIFNCNLASVNRLKPDYIPHYIFKLVILQQDI